MSQELTGATIGNYKIEGLLGSGGMGQVYRGTHVLLNRKAAVKVMHQHLAADPNFRARFLQEAKAAADLDHPNVVRVHDFGEHEDQFYLVMELIDGGSLRTLLRERTSNRGSWSTRNLLVLIRQAAEGLDYAHRRGMVHRDIKPDNLLLTPESDGDQGTRTLKISDFGLARLAESAVMTASGVTMGTPAYLSPEQAQGKELDGRSDIYSLGVVIYEIATGYLPFDTRTLSDAVYKHVHVAPTPPRRANPDVSETVEEVILRCLEKDPAARYAGAAELSRALQAVAEGIDPKTVVPGPGVTQVADRGTTTRMPEIGETVLDQPGDQPPRFVPTLIGATDSPRIQVLRENGTSYQVVDLTNNGLTVGRLAGNDLVLPDDSVSRHHLRIEWNGSEVSVTDLGSRNGALLGGHRLLPQVPQTWNPADWLQVGSFWVRLDLPGTGSAYPSRSQMTAASPVTPRAAPVADGRLQVMLDDRELSIVPGQPVAVHGTLVNLGKTVDHVSLSVDGVPEEWVRIPSQEVQLNPGAQSPLILQVSVPRDPTSYAGQYPVTVRGRSRENPGETGVGQALWTVQPFAESQMTLTPARAGGRTRAAYKLALANAGNQTARFSFRGRDDEDALEYKFKRDHVELAPDENATIPLDVGAPRRWVGSAEDRSFRIESLTPTGVSQSVDGRMQHKAMIPTWAIPVIGIALVGLFLLINFLLTPSIQAFEMDQVDGGYLPGQDVTLSWDVSRARSVEIVNLPEGIDLQDNGDLPGRSEFTLTPNWTGDRTITLVAKSLFKTREEEIQVPVLPPDPDAPLIQEFSVEPSSLTAGETVTISWQVDGADNVTLQLPDGTTHDGLPSEGELPDTPSETGAYILKASNEGVSGAPELLQVEVAAPGETPTPDSDESSGNGDEEEGDDENGGDGDDMPDPDPTPAPVFTLDPVDDVEIAEGACLTLAWDIQHAAMVNLNGDPVDAAGEQMVCPEATTSYTWNVDGQDGQGYSESRTVQVEPMDVDGTTTIDDVTGTWVNVDPNTFGMTRIIITEDEDQDDTIAVETFVRCVPPSECELDEWGIDLGSASGPADFPKPVVLYDEPQEMRVVIGRKGDELITRIYYSEFDYLHEFVLEPQVIVVTPFPLPTFDVFEPGMFDRDQIVVMP